ncbi:MAG: NAD(P)H-hydrate dehydratase [Clostridia bacterium]|nr:NAD(P)H-hydrate dehydratase [Clostridia bacterium]
MQKVLTTTQMAYCDSRTIDGGIPSTELMRRVAQAVYDSRVWQGSVAIICGKGNNGGDGLALAGIMADNGKYPRVYLMGDMSKDGRYYYDVLQDKGYERIYPISECDYDFDIIVDCIFGTGFKGQPRQQYADVIDKINASRAYKISVDIPSGLDGDNGRYVACVKADETITVQYAKSGLYLNDGKDMTGSLSIIDVGIGLYTQAANVVEEKDVAALFPRRKHNTHKGTFGKSAILGGCGNYLGAVRLANMGLCALRSGGGLNVIITPQSHVNNVLGTVMESTVIGIADDRGYFVFDRQGIDRALQGVDSLAIGMGMGNRYSENAKIIEYIVANYPIKVIIDADGLNSLALNVEMLKCAKAQIILTPHVKEMSRLCDKSVEEILDDPISIARSFAEEYKVTVLLKGASSVIADGRQVYMITNGGAELSKGGSGDTLSGVMLGMLSQGIPPTESAYSSAYLTARVAKDLTEEYSEYGVLPSDVARAICKIITK